MNEWHKKNWWCLSISNNNNKPVGPPSAARQNKAAQLSGTRQAAKITGEAIAHQKTISGDSMGSQSERRSGRAWHAMMPR
jgi:hypothetical protein